MTLRKKILALFAVGLLVGFGLFGYWVRAGLRDSYGQSVEELMVDVSQLLAALVEEESRAHGDALATEGLGHVFKNYRARRFSAKIFDLEKEEPSLNVYVTDAKGTVLFSTESADDVGRDFSRWRDVRLTLEGRYGSRSTRRNPEDKSTSVFYVAAPVRDRNGRILGSVSVIKDRASVAGIVESALLRMLALALLVIALTLGLGSLLFQWITRPLQQLREYALAVSAGQRTPLPPLAGREILEVGAALEQMRVALEGKKTVERIAQALSHEIKSPLSAIQGAAELLQEPSMDPAKRDRFLANIVDESDRARTILERLLEVAALEAKTALDRREPVELQASLAAARDGLLGLFSRRKIDVTLGEPNGAGILGDPFLVQQAIRNLLQNAIEFSPEGGRVRAWVELGPGEVRVAVEDAGPGLPPYARERLFEKFFSLERPASPEGRPGRKGSGLGLSFVREVMELHGGRVWLDSPLGDAGGTRAWLGFPL